MADSKRISIATTLPNADIEIEQVDSDLKTALAGIGFSVLTVTTTKPSGTTSQSYLDVLVPTGQSDPTSVTQITTAVNATSNIDGASYTAGTVTCATVAAEASPVDPIGSQTPQTPAPGAFPPW